MINYKKAKKFTKFMLQGKQPYKPIPMSEKDKQFILKMIKDELLELKKAKNDVEQIDAFCDIIYYIYTHACSKGINLDPFLDIVHKSNLSKFPNGSVKRRESDGKVLKPKTFIPPEPLIEKELERQKNSFSLLDFYI